MVLGYFYAMKMEFYIEPFDNPKSYPGEELATFKNEAHIDLMQKALPKLTKSNIIDIIHQLYDKSLLEKNEGQCSNN